MRLHVTAVAAATSIVAAQQQSWSLTLLKSYPQAQCLDGTPGGYYFAPGSGADAGKWLIHLQGGGWCINLDDCLARSTTELGSSTSWPATGCPTDDGGCAGMYNADPAINPYFATWTKVYIKYCDGASFAGTVAAPVNVSNHMLYFRGRAILDATITDLLTGRGLSGATDIVLKGCSAGGLATYIHADYVGTRMPASAKYVAMPGAGFFLDIPGVDGNYHYRANYQTVFAMQNVSASTNLACMASYGPADQWRCFSAPYVLPHIVTPVFISNSLIDQWQAGNIMALGCDPTQRGQCNATQLAYLATFRQAMITAAAPALTGTVNGAYLQTCFVHVVIDIDKSWNGTRVANQTQIDTFASWYWRKSPGVSTQVVDGGVGDNDSCY